MRNYWLVIFLFCIGTAQAQFVRNSGLTVINSANVAVTSDWDNQNYSITNNGTITLSDNWTSTGGYNPAGTGGFVLTNAVTKQFNHNKQFVATLTKNGAGITQVNDRLIIKNNLTLTIGLLSFTGVNDTLVMQTNVVSTATPTSYVVGKVTRYGNGDLFFPVSRASNYLPITISQVAGTNPRVTVSVEDKPVYTAGTNVTGLNTFPYVWRSAVLRGDTATYVEVQYPTSLATPAATIIARGVTGSLFAGMGMQSTTVGGVTKIKSYARGLRGLFTLAQGPGVPTGTAPIDPVATAATAIAISAFTANWSAVTGATGYQLDISADNFSTFLAGYNAKPLTVTTEILVGLTAGTAYKYRVRATNASGTSVNSNAIDVTTLPLPTVSPVALAATAISQTAFTANWGVVSGATGYQLDISADNFATFITGYNSKAVTAVTEVVSGLTANTAYKYRVRATSAAPTSVNSNVIDVTTSLLPTVAPVATAATAISQTGFTANWGAVSGAIGYQLDISADNFATFIAGYNSKAVTAVSEVLSGLTANTAYKYRVRATSAAPTSVSSNVIDVTTLPVPVLAAPVATAATSITSTGFTANWNAVAGATGYQLDISADNFATFLTGYNSKSVTATTEVVTGLTASTAYKYRVRATNALGTSASSNIIDVTTLPVPVVAAPVATAATSITQTGFTANWNAVTGATGYRLDVSADNFVNLITGFADKTVTGISDAATGLTPGTVYKYRVRAVDATSTSVNSNVIDVTTLAKQNQTITFPAIADKTLGGPAFTIGATASSGLAVSYATASDKITISNGVATLVKAGRETIEASQSGDATFNAATTLIQSFCIRPAKPTITVSGANTEAITLTSSASVGNQWFKDGNAITGATNATLSVTAIGVYKVQVKVDDCVSEFSADTPFIITGDLSTQSNTITIYPNPVEDYLEVRGLKEEVNNSQLSDMTGRTNTLTLEQKSAVHRANVQHLAAGVYLLRVQQGNSIYQIKFIKK